MPYCQLKAIQKGQILGEGRESVSATNRSIMPHYADKSSASKELTRENEERRKSMWLLEVNLTNQSIKDLTHITGQITGCPIGHILKGRWTD